MASGLALPSTQPLVRGSFAIEAQAKKTNVLDHASRRCSVERLQRKTVGPSFLKSTTQKELGKSGAGTGAVTKQESLRKQAAKQVLPGCRDSEKHSGKLNQKEQACPIADILGDVTAAMALPVMSKRTFHQRARQERTPRPAAPAVLTALLPPVPAKRVPAGPRGTLVATDTLKRRIADVGAEEAIVGDAFQHILSHAATQDEELPATHRMNIVLKHDHDEHEEHDGYETPFRLQEFLDAHADALHHHDRHSVHETEWEAHQFHKARPGCLFPTNPHSDTLSTGDMKTAVFGESEEFHEQGVRRMRRQDYETARLLMLTAWEIMDSELGARDAADDEEIEKIKKAYAEECEERGVEVDTEMELMDVKMVLFRQQERCKLEKQTKIELGFDISVTCARLKDWGKVDEICGIVLSFFGPLGNPPQVAQEDEERWIQLMIRRGVACAFLGKGHFSRSISYFHDVLKLVPTHKRAKRCVQVVRFLDAQLVAGTDEAKSALLALMAET